jgi:hypothetical protein
MQSTTLELQATRINKRREKKNKIKTVFFFTVRAVSVEA